MPPKRRLLTAQLVAYALAWAVVLALEIPRLRDLASATGDEADGLASLFVGMNPDTMLMVPLLLAAPFCWFLGRSRSARGTYFGAVFVFLLSVGVTYRVGREFDGLPPAFHDEYSYLFQARTFAAGRLSYPSHELPRFFDQMHVLNEGRFAGRYFPGTALWMTPFVWVGNPYLGHLFAGGVVAVLVYLIGRELGGTGVGLLAGTLTALSPGMAVFGNLLLSHHPTMVGLFAFIYCYLRTLRSERPWFALLGGAALAFAVMCRPLTAAAVALPFGVHFLCTVITRRGLRRDRFLPSAGEMALDPLTRLTPNGPLPSRRARLRQLLAAAIPLALGVAAMLAYNAAITSDPLLSPYQQYTEIYTPRHQYGFENVARAHPPRNPIMGDYDRWAENLDLPLALDKLVIRLRASAQWTAGLVPTLMAAVVFVLLLPWMAAGWWLIGAAVLALHAAHFPYWYEGNLGWHYVFETGPMLALIVAGTSVCMIRRWSAADGAQRAASRGERRKSRVRDRGLLSLVSRLSSLGVWWMVVLAVSLLTLYASAEPFWTARLPREVAQVRWARALYAHVHARVEQLVEPPAVVFVTPAEPATQHIDFVQNDPALSNPVLFARDLGPADNRRLMALMPGRTFYLYDYRDGRLVRYDPPDLSHD